MQALWSALIVGVALVASSSIACAQDTGAEALVEGFVHAWNSHDLSAFENLFAADAEWVTSFDARDQGREAIIADLRVAHEGWAKTSSVAASKVLVKPLRPDIAIIHFNLAMTMNEEGAPIGRTLLVVASKHGSAWKIDAGQLTKPNCP